MKSVTSCSGSAGSAGIVIALRIFHSSPLAVPVPHRRGEILDGDHDADEAVLLARVVRGPELEHHLVLVADVELLHVLAVLQVPHVHGVAVLAAEELLGDDAALEHRRRRPLARDERALVQVPTEVVLVALRAGLVLRRAERLERLAVEPEQPARLVRTVRAAETAHVDRVGAAMRGVGARVAGLRRELVGLDRLHDLRRARVVLHVEHVDARRLEAWHDEVAALDVRPRRRRAQCGAARVPAEVMQLVAGRRELDGRDDLAVGVRAALEVDHPERVRPRLLVGLEQRDVRERLLRRLHRELGRGIETRVRRPACHHTTSRRSFQTEVTELVRAAKR